MLYNEFYESQNKKIIISEHLILFEFISYLLILHVHRFRNY